jgi:hypothetical protein
MQGAFFSAKMSAMDENRRGYDLSAPQHLPDHNPFPRVDDHLVEPEVTRDQIIGGHRVVKLPADPPHATQQSRLNFVLLPHVVPGYTAASDLLTRFDQESDFASSTCIYKDDVDPATGTRYLEEIAFEVVSEQNEGWAMEKAWRMHRRGVRRIFSIWVETQQVCEWSPESESWLPLEPVTRIADPCLVTPLPVAALLDKKKADYAVIDALVAKGTPAIQDWDAAAEAREEMKGRAKSILVVLEARDIPVDEAQRQEILRCQDLDRLSRWLRRAVSASSAGEVTSEP